MVKQHLLCLGGERFVPRADQKVIINPNSSTKHLTSPANSTPIPIRKEHINAKFIGHQAAYCGWNFPTSSVSLAVAKHLKEALHSPK